MALDAYARIGAALASASGVVPSIALVMGHCGGIAAACAQMQDFVILLQGGRAFVNGPQVAGAKALDDIAGGEAAMKGGACHIVAESDEAALGLPAKLVSLLPDNNMEDALNETGDDVNRELPAYNEIETLKTRAPGRGTAGRGQRAGAFRRLRARGDHHAGHHRRPQRGRDRHAARRGGRPPHQGRLPQGRPFRALPG